MLKVDRQSGGFTPWNLYPARNVETNGHIEVEYFNLLTPDGTIPLGFYYSSKRFFPKTPPNQYWWSFFMSILVNDTWCKARKTEHESNEDLIII